MQKQLKNSKLAFRVSNATCYAKFIIGGERKLTSTLSSFLEFFAGYQQRIASKLFHWNSNYIQNTHLLILLLFLQMENSIPLEKKSYASRSSKATKKTI